MAEENVISQLPVGEGLHYVYRDQKGNLCRIQLDWDLRPEINQLPTLALTRLQKMLLRARLEYALELVDRG